MLNIQHNLLAQNANRQLGINTNKNTKITEKLSSGYKINRAADDAAGLAISEKMRRQVRGLNQGASNIKDGIGYVQTAEGALNEVHDMLQRINELAVQAANGTNTETDRAYIDSEVQALKRETDRIFETTTFNEQRIWQVEKSREILGYQTVEGIVKFNDSYTYMDITDENCGVIAQGGYNMKANENGITVSWKGYNGKSYATNTISWEELRRNNYRFEISDYFKATDTDLISPTTGEKMIKHRVSMDVNNSVEFDDIKSALIDTINGPYNYGTTISQSASSPISVRLEDSGGNEIRKNWLGTNTRVSFSVGLTYPTAYQSYINSIDSNDGYDFDTPRDAFMEPTIDGTPDSVGTPNFRWGDDDKWTFTFYMKGVGVVTAESSRVSYTSSDRDDDSEGHWWRWIYPQNGSPYQWPYTYPRLTSTSGTLGDVMDALTGPDGLLDTSKGGNTYSGGNISLSFTLTTRNSDGTTTDIGNMSTTIPIIAGAGGDDVGRVQDRIQDVFNDNTILDIYTDDSNVQSSAGSIRIYETKWLGEGDIPIYGTNFIYGGVHNFFVQAGAEAGQHISIEYDALNNIIIGIEDTNVLTQESAGNAINEVKGALQKISEQRSDFGAYQNRLEHAYNINNNTSENTQSAESVIRDADIADMMMEYSINNILMQAGTSMLAQANQSNQTAVELLQ